MSTVSKASDNQAFLAQTSMLDYKHPSIQLVVETLTKDLSTNKQKAVAIHNFVRDNIKFGFNADFYNMTASEVLLAGRGFCNNQSTLFSAMLRAAGIPSRHRFYSLDAQILSSILDPGTPYVDHAVVEVLIDDKWLRVDSYIVDSTLLAGAKQRLSAAIGMGIRKDASGVWSGMEDSFSQFHPDYIGMDFGVFEDVNDFYENAPKPNNKVNFFTALLVRFTIESANKQVAKIREIHMADTINQIHDSKLNKSG